MCWRCAGGSALHGDCPALPFLYVGEEMRSPSADQKLNHNSTPPPPMDASCCPTWLIREPLIKVPQQLRIKYEGVPNPGALPSQSTKYWNPLPRLRTSRILLTV